MRRTDCEGGSPRVRYTTARFRHPAWRRRSRETRAIPIVFVGVIDPIGGGLVASLARPGGNLTGTLLNEEGIVGKWLAMLKEMAPQLARVAIL